MAVLITGASGFLGSRLVKRVANEGYDVIAVDRRPAPTSLELHPRIQWIVQDITMDGLALSGIRNIEAVVHLAGGTLGAGKDENLFLQTNEQTTVRLLQAIADRTDRCIFASSQVVYGNACHLSVTENFPLLPDGSAYACSKLNSENWLRWFQKRHGGQYLALRFCGFIDGGGIIDYIIDRALAGKKIELYSQGKVCRDYITSEDGIEVLMAALKYRHEPGFLPVNIGSGQAITAQNVAEIVCDESQSSSQIELCESLSPQGNFVFCIDRARELFNFNPVLLSESVRNYTRYRQDQKIK